MTATHPGTDVDRVDQPASAELLARVAGFLGIDPRDPRTEAAVVLAARYGLDALAGDLVVVENRAPTLSLTGLRRVAQRSGLDGVTEGPVVHDDTRREWRATVSVWRVGCSRPFTFTGAASDLVVTRRGPEPDPHARARAVSRAERRALRAAFVLAVDTGDPDDADPGDGITGPVPVDVDPDAPAPVGLLRAVAAAAEHTGITDRGELLAVAGYLLAHPITAGTDLTTADAERLLAALTDPDTGPSLLAAARAHHDDDTTGVDPWA